MALGLTLDSETLTMLAADDPRAVAIVKAARSVGALVHVPAVVLAEAITGDTGRDARVNRTVKLLEVIAADEAVGRLAGRLRYATARTEATIDALVVASAFLYGGRRLFAVDPDVHILAEAGGVRSRSVPGRG